MTASELAYQFTRTLVQSNKIKLWTRESESIVHSSDSPYTAAKDDDKDDNHDIILVYLPPKYAVCMLIAIFAELVNIAHRSRRTGSILPTDPSVFSGNARPTMVPVLNSPTAALPVLGVAPLQETESLSPEVCIIYTLDKFISHSSVQRTISSWAPSMIQNYFPIMVVLFSRMTKLV